MRYCDLRGKWCQRGECSAGCFIRPSIPDEVDFNDPLCPACDRHHTGGCPAHTSDDEYYDDQPTAEQAAYARSWGWDV